MGSAAGRAAALRGARRLSSTRLLLQPKTFDPRDEGVDRPDLDHPATERTDGPCAKIRRCFLATGALFDPGIRRGPSRASRELAAFVDQIPTTMVMQEMAVPRATHVLARGQYDQPGAKVSPGVPRCLSAGQEASVA